MILWSKEADLFLLKIKRAVAKQMAGFLSAVTEPSHTADIADISNGAISFSSARKLGQSIDVIDSTDNDLSEDPLDTRFASAVMFF